MRHVCVGRDGEASRVLVRMRKQRALNDTVLSCEGSFFLLKLKSILN